MLSGLLTVSYFLLSLLFTTLLFLLWSRVFLRFFRISSLQPVSKMINQFSQSLVRPIESLWTQKNKSKPQYDVPALIMIMIVEIVKMIILGLLAYRQLLPLPYLIILIFADLIIQPLNLLFYALIVRVVLSWLGLQWQHHPVNEVVQIITDPLIRFGHKLIPNVSGFDFSPFIMMIGLKVITLFISSSLPIPLL